MSDKNVIINYVTLLNDYYNNGDKIRFLERLGDYRKKHPAANETLQLLFAHGVNNELTRDEVNAIFCVSAYTTSPEKGDKCSRSRDLTNFIKFINQPLSTMTGGKKSKKRRSKKNKKTKRRTKRYRM